MQRSYSAASIHGTVVCCIPLCSSPSNDLTNLFLNEYSYMQLPIHMYNVAIERTNDSPLDTVGSIHYADGDVHVRVCGLFVS